MEAFRCDHISINPITFTSSSTKVLLSLISHIHMATILPLGGGLTYLKLLCEAATLLVLYLAIFTFISSKRQSTRKHSESPVIIQRWTILAWSYFQVTCVTQSAKMGLEATSLNFNLALIWNERRRRRKKDMFGEKHDSIFDRLLTNPHFTASNFQISVCLKSKNKHLKLAIIVITAPGPL